MRPIKQNRFLGGFAAVTCSLFMCIGVEAASPLPDDLQLVPSGSLPAQATWLSVKMWGQYPPSPYNWLAGADNVLYYRSASLGTNFVLIDDTQVDYAAQMMNVSPLDASGPPMPGGGNDGGTNYGGGGFIGPKYGQNDLWLQLVFDPDTTNQPSSVDLLLHGATNGYWQILSKTNLTDSHPWNLGTILTNYNQDNPFLLEVVPYQDPPIQFFWAVGGDTVVSIAPSSYFYSAFEPCSPGDVNQPAVFDVSITPTVARSFTVKYTLSGTAINGVDYTNLNGAVEVPPDTSPVHIYVEPLHDGTNYPDFDETVSATLVLTNGYLVDTNKYTASVTIHECLSNLLQVVATNVPAPVAIDYSPSAKSLLLAINLQDPTLTDPAFGMLSSNGLFSSWSSLTCAQVTNSDHEVRIATVKITTNGFTAGDLFFGNDAPGGIAWVSADGSSYDLNWARNSALTNEPEPIQVLYFDETGVWSNDLLVVCGLDTAAGGNRDIWRVHSKTNAQLIASIPTPHLEGLLTVSNNSRYGPLAGMLLSGDEGSGLIYAVGTNGVYTNFSLGINPDCFRLIPTNSDLYCVYFNKDDYSQSQVLKLKRDSFTNYVGDIVVEQAGEGLADAPTVFILHWNAAGTNFVTHSIPFLSYLPGSWNFEKLTFAPIDVPPVQ